jgi:hypothetical protein
LAQNNTRWAGIAKGRLSDRFLLCHAWYGATEREARHEELIRSYGATFLYARVLRIVKKLNRTRIEDWSAIGKAKSTIFNRLQDKK